MVNLDCEDLRLMGDHHRSGGPLLEEGFVRDVVDTLVC